MQAALLPQFEAIEQQRRTIKTQVCALSAAQLAKKTAPEAWSIQQIVEHLVLSDETMGQARQTLETEARMFRVLPRALRRVLVLSAFRRNAVLPLPLPAVEPSGTLPLPELLKRWEKARAEMQSVLEAVERSEARWSHPVLGPLTALQMLTLSEAHTAYHMRQMDTRKL